MTQALRKTVEEALRNGLRSRGYDDYPEDESIFEEGVVDIAGSILTAIAGVFSSEAVKEQIQFDIDEVVGRKFSVNKWRIIHFDVDGNMARVERADGTFPELAEWVEIEALYKAAKSDG